MTSKSKGGSRRKNTPFPGLKKELHPRPRRHYIDQDYINKLSDEEKEFLSKFNDEYYGASLAKVDDLQAREKDFHKTAEERKTCYDRNNACNRDVSSVGLVNELNPENPEALTAINYTVTSIRDKRGKSKHVYQVDTIDLKNYEDLIINVIDSEATKSTRDE